MKRRSGISSVHAINSMHLEPYVATRSKHDAHWQIYPLSRFSFFFSHLVPFRREFVWFRKLLECVDNNYSRSDSLRASDEECKFIIF